MAAFIRSHGEWYPWRCLDCEALICVPLTLKTGRVSPESYTTRPPLPNKRTNRVFPVISALRPFSRMGTARPSRAWLSAIELTLGPLYTLSEG